MERVRASFSMGKQPEAARNAVMSVFNRLARKFPSGFFCFRLMVLMQACTVEGGHWAAVDHAVIRGLVTARPWCVAGLPLSPRGSRVPSVSSRIALTGFRPPRACRMMIRLVGQP